MRYTKPIRTYALIQREERIRALVLRHYDLDQGRKMARRPTGRLTIADIAQRERMSEEQVREIARRFR